MGAGASNRAHVSMTHPLDRLDLSSRVAKRAQYEAFDFTLEGPDVRVRNESHANPDEHEYLVSIEDGLPASCSCPADERFEGACKHRVAVAIRKPILEAAQTRTASDTPLVSDGGVVPDSSESADASEDHPADEADRCSECLPEFPCWDCFRTGRRPIE